jgi:hypothetical protein
MHREQGFFPSHFTWKEGLSGAVSLEAMEASLLTLLILQ